MSSKETDLFSILMGLAMIPVIVILQAFIATDLWLWFIVPLGVAKVGMAHMYGIMLTIRIAAQASSSSSKDDSDNIWVPIIASVLGYIVVWGIAAITHNCM